MSKINWKVRVQKKSFWAAIVSAVALFINNIANAFGLDYSSQVQTGVDIVSSILTLLAGLGIITDMTTKGIGDSEIAKTYDKPRDSKDPEQYVNWEGKQDLENKEGLKEQLGIKEPKNYDTSEEFSDDSDEEEEVEIDNEGGGSPEELSEEEKDNSEETALVPEENTAEENKEE